MRWLLDAPLSQGMAVTPWSGINLEGRADY